MNQHQKNGAMAELLAMVYFIKNDYVISRPMIDSHCQYDLIVEKDNEFSRIQVKNVYFENSSQRYKCKLFTSHRMGHKNNGKHTFKIYPLPMLLPP